MKREIKEEIIKKRKVIEEKKREKSEEKVEERKKLVGRKVREYNFRKNWKEKIYEGLYKIKLSDDSEVKRRNRRGEKISAE